MKTKLVPLIVFVVMAVALGVGLTLDPSKVPSPLIGKPAPAFSAPRLLQPERSLSLEDMKGQVAVLNVWASWCTACRDEHPLLLELTRRVEVALYGLNYKDQREVAVQWLEELGNSYRAIAYDPQGSIGIDWGVYGVPETFILDAAGVIRHKHIGAIDRRALEQEIIPWIRRLSAEAQARA